MPDDPPDRTARAEQAYAELAASAGTLTGLADDIAALRTAIDAVAARVRHHEEQVRQLNRKKQ